MVQKINRKEFDLMRGSSSSTCREEDEAKACSVIHDVQSVTVFWSAGVRFLRKESTLMDIPYRGRSASTGRLSPSESNHLYLAKSA